MKIITSLMVVKYHGFARSEVQPQHLLDRAYILVFRIAVSENMVW